MSELEKHRRRQFVAGVLKPVAMGVLGRCETGEIVDGAQIQAFRFGDFFHDAGHPRHAANQHNLVDVVLGQARVL